MVRWRVGIAEMMQESNTFCARASTEADFLGGRNNPELVVTPALRASHSEVAGFLDALNDVRSTVDAVPLVQLSALAGGPLPNRLYRWLLEVWEDALRCAGPLDAILMALHGALVATTDDDVDGTLLRVARAHCGPETILAASLDLHALITIGMVETANILVGYRTYPHVDQREVGREVGRLTLQALEQDIRPFTVVARRPFLVPPDGASTAAFPMAAWEASARSLEGQTGVLSASCFPVQPWLDVPDLASAATVVVNPALVIPNAAQQWAEALVEEGWQYRRAFHPDRLEPAIAVERALTAPAGPVVVADLGDGTAGGGLGDSPILLDLLLQRQPQRRCVVPVVDPEAVNQCWAVGVGQRVHTRVGGGLHPQWFQPVVLEGEVVQLWSGQFTLEGPYFRGRSVDAGRIAVLRSGKIAVILQERPLLTSDPALYRAVGLDPEDHQVVVVKSPLLFRAAFADMAQSVVLADTPGPTDHHFERLPFVRVGRPLFPLDKV